MKLEQNMPIMFARIRAQLVKAFGLCSRHIGGVRPNAERPLWVAEAAGSNSL